MTAVASNPPTLSVIMAALNEASTIDVVLRSLLAQSGSFELREILVIDGGSSDGTRSIVSQHAEHDRRIRLLDNPRRRTPFAFNIGLRAATAEYVAILGAHAMYAPDYLDVCLSEMRAHGADGCSGRVLTAPANDGLEARLACWAIAHPFGSSPRSFRNRPEGFVDSIPYPVFLRQALLDVGGYDETLLRNQDNDMNQRLRASGRRLYYTSRTFARYHPQSTIAGLLRYAFRNGVWNVVTLRVNRAAMGLRHFVPLALVLALVLCTVLALAGGVLRSPVLGVPLAILLFMHLAAGLLAAVDVAIRERTPLGLLLPPLFFGLHVAYGAGSLWALLTGEESSHDRQ